LFPENLSTAATIFIRKYLPPGSGLADLDPMGVLGGSIAHFSSSAMRSAEDRRLPVLPASAKAENDRSECMKSNDVFVTGFII